MDEDDLIFQAEETSAPGSWEDRSPWRILIVDDEEEVHHLTRLVLGDFKFQGRGLEFLSAFSGEEAREVLQREKDIALILLDVVMETEDSGLQVVQYIRQTLENHLVRIILRTGQPGQAPEERVIVDYDINDYKAKTELTARKLLTTVITALRAYQDLTTIELGRLGLEKIIQASARIFELQSMKKFSQGVLTQLTGLLGLSRHSAFCKTNALALETDPQLKILAATGDFAALEDQAPEAVLPPRVVQVLKEARSQGQSVFAEDHYVGYFKTRSGSENLLYLEGWKHLEEAQKRLIQVFCSNVAVAYDNLYLNQEIEDTQRDVIFTLGDIIENRSRDTGNHVRRVAEYSEKLALLLGLPPEEAARIRLASPMHDLGKLAIPDSILDKPGPLTPEEYQTMKTHPQLGWEMLKGSPRPLLRTAALMALQHHEKYDGTGYPQGLKGEEIHLYGRITSVADVFDALSTHRVYRKALTLPEIRVHFEKERGVSFDPQIVDLLLSHLEEFLPDGVPG